MKSIKKLLSLILIISLSLNINIYAEGIDVNTDTADVGYEGGGGGFGGKYGWETKVKGARVSLWNVETQTLIDSKNIINFAQVPYEEVLKYRSLSHLTKPEIIELNYEMNADMDDNLYGLKGMGDMLSPNSVKVPDEIYFLPSQTAKQRTQKVKEFYGKAENVEKLFNEMKKLSEDDKNLWQQGKAVILLEPLIAFYNGKEDIEHTWIMTCAELGLLAVNGYAESFEPFSATNLASTFKYVAFGTYKENAGLITSIAPYETTGTIASNALEKMSGWKDMVDRLGCLEISTLNIATSSTADNIPIKFHANLEHCGIGGTTNLDAIINR